MSSGELGRHSIRLFRVCLYGAALVHFFPTIRALDDNYGQAAYRVTNWNQAAFELLHGSSLVVMILIATAVGASIAGILGLWPKVSALSAGVSWYSLASINSLHSQSLALCSLWALLSLWAILGEPNEPTQLETLRQCAAFYLVGSVFFSGLEKVRCGWPFSGSLSRLSHYPPGGFVRDWLLALGPCPAGVSTILEAGVVAVELGVPVLLILPQTRQLGVLLWTLFFVLITATLAVPLLFVLLYLGGALLLANPVAITARGERSAQGS